MFYNVQFQLYHIVVFSLKCHCLQKCAICGKGKKSPNGATAGCAVQTCRKSFHFYCARTTATAVARKMVETLDSGTEIDRYL